MLNEIKEIKSGKKELREFGLTIGIILAILGALIFRRGRRELTLYFLAAGALFIILGLVVPRILKPIQKIWMGISIIIGFFVSRFVLLMLFYLVLTPIGLIAKLMGKDMLDQKIEKEKGSYWRARDSSGKTKESYENQY